MGEIQSRPGAVKGENEKGQNEIHLALPVVKDTIFNVYFVTGFCNSIHRPLRPRIFPMLIRDSDSTSELVLLNFYSALQLLSCLRLCSRWSHAYRIYQWHAGTTVERNILIIQCLKFYTTTSYLYNYRH